MSTRGAKGFYCNGITKLAFNSHDSYPSYLGKKLFKNAKKIAIKYRNDRDKLVYRINKLLLTDLEDESDLSTVLFTDLIKLEKFSNNSGFIKDSLFCEWGYILNVDYWTFEIYKGAQKEPQDNRYRIDKPVIKTSDFYNCKLIKTIPLDDLIFMRFKEILPLE